MQRYEWKLYMDLFRYRPTCGAKGPWRRSPSGAPSGIQMQNGKSRGPLDKFNRDTVSQKSVNTNNPLSDYNSIYKYIGTESWLLVVPLEI